MIIEKMAGYLKELGYVAYWISGNIPWVTTSEISFCEIKNTNEKITELGLKNSSAKLFPKGTILMAMYGQGKTRGQVAKLGISASTNQACAAIILNSGYNQNFYFQYLWSRYEQLRDIGNEGTQKNLNGGLLKEVIVPVPPENEQQKIAQILSTWDKAIETLEALIAAKKKRKKALMQQLLTGKMRFPGFEEEWRSVQLSKICELGTGQSAPQEEKYFLNGNYDFLRVSDIGRSNQRWTPNSRDKINELAIKDSCLKLVPKGATIFTKSGASLLLNQRAQLKEDCYVVSHLGYAKAKNNVSDDFVYFLFCRIDFKNYAAGTSLPALKISTLSKIKVKIPTCEGQQKIASVLSAADKEITIHKTQISALKQQKTGLMQQLLTGKKRVQLNQVAA